MESSVRPGYGPTLSELLRPRVPRWGRIALAIAAVVLVVGVIVGRDQLLNRGTEYVHRDGMEFNFVHGNALQRVAPRDDEFVRLEGRTRAGTFLQSFAVGPLQLPSYRGEPSAFLPLFAERIIDGLPRRYPGFELILERRERVIDVIGYSIVFRQRGTRPLRYGRIVLVPEPKPGARRGVLIEILATRGAGVSVPDDVGTTGAVRRPFRSFRFGTEGP